MFSGTIAGASDSVGMATSKSSNSSSSSSKRVTGGTGGGSDAWNAVKSPNSSSFAASPESGSVTWASKGSSNGPMGSKNEGSTVMSLVETKLLISASSSSNADRSYKKSPNSPSIVT